MSKGLARSLSRGAPQRQEIIKQVIKVRNLSIEVDGAAGVGFGTVVLGDLPEGNVLFLGGIAYLTFDAPASGITATWNGDYAVGTTPTADATVTGTDANLIALAAVGPAVATVSPRTRGEMATQAMFDNTDGSLEVNLNLIVDDADISTDDVVIVVNGEVFLTYIVLADD